MRYVLRLLLKCSLFLVGAVVFAWLFMQFMNGVAFVDAFSSLVMLIIMCVIFIRSNITWARPQKAIMIICGLALLALFVDARGNLIYNLPLQLLAPEGTTLNTVVSSNNIEGSLTTVDYKHLFVDGSNQVVEELERKIVLGFRFFEYLVIGVGLVSLHSKYGYLVPEKFYAKNKKPRILGD